jgi:hypothetical protein
MVLSALPRRDLVNDIKKRSKTFIMTVWSLTELRQEEKLALSPSTSTFLSISIHQAIHNRVHNFYVELLSQQKIF